MDGAARRVNYDYDVVVVGGGLAGLSAAVRARWVKRHHAVPCSTAILEPGALGGLANWKSQSLTGPSLRFPGKELTGRILRDVRALRIPVIAEAAAEIRAERGLWRVRTGAGRTLRALSVILATGLRPLTNEHDYFGRDISIAYMGYSFFPTLFAQILRKGARRLVIVGNEKALQVRRVVEAANTTGAGVVYLVDPTPGSRGVPEGPDVVLGRAVRFVGRGRLRGVRYVQGGVERVLPCDHAFLEYNGFELRPAFTPTLSGLRRTRAGFLAVDRAMGTNLPGVFAAGDATGDIAAASKAIAEGVIAGLSAYAYVFGRKFGREPTLFAYKATDFEIPPDFREIPALAAASPVVLVSEARDLAKHWARIPAAAGVDASAFAEAAAARPSLSALSRRMRMPLATGRALVTALIERKLATVHA